MRTPRSLRTVTFFLMSASIGAAAIVVMPLHAQTGPVAALRTESAVDQQILVLQAQVKSLQAQLSILATAVQVTPAGLVLQGPTVTVTGRAIAIQTQEGLSLRVGKNLSLEAEGVTALRTGGDLQLTVGGAASITSSAALDLRGASIRLNGGSKPVALFGSSANGLILNGSSTVLAN